MRALHRLVEDREAVAGGDLQRLAGTGRGRGRPCSRWRRRSGRRCRRLRVDRAPCSAWIVTRCRRGSSQCSRVSRPTSQKRRAIASRSPRGRLRNQPRCASVCVDQRVDEAPADLARSAAWRGGGRRRCAPRRARRAARPTRRRSGGRRRSARARRSKPSKSTRSQVCSPSAGPLRRVGEVRDARGGDDLAGLDRTVARSRPTKCPSWRSAVTCSSSTSRPGLLGEPLRVGQEERERDRVLADLLLVEVALEGQLVRRGRGASPGPERRNMPAGMCSRQKAMWRPTMRVLRPLSRAALAAARPYGPAPMTRTSSNAAAGSPRPVPRRRTAWRRRSRRRGGAARRRA